LEQFNGEIEHRSTPGPSWQKEVIRECAKNRIKPVYLDDEQVLVSSMFYKQLLHEKIPNAKRDTDDLTVFFTLLGFARAKAAHKTLMKLTSGLSFTPVVAKA